MAKWKGIVDKGFNAEEFKAYCSTLKLKTWKPKFLVVHNTWAPTLKDWKTGKWKPEQRIGFLVGYYRDNKKWSSGPHLFIDDKKIWVFTPLTTSGTHSPSWNNDSWGVEIVGNFDIEPFEQDKLVYSAIATLCRLGDLDPKTIKFHKEDPKTTHKTCPGKNVKKDVLISEVIKLLQN